MLKITTEDIYIMELFLQTNSLSLYLPASHPWCCPKASPSKHVPANLIKEQSWSPSTQIHLDTDLPADGTGLGGKGPHHMRSIETPTFAATYSLALWLFSIESPSEPDWNHRFRATSFLFPYRTIAACCCAQSWPKKILGSTCVELGALNTYPCMPASQPSQVIFFVGSYIPESRPMGQMPTKTDTS